MATNSRTPLPSGLRRFIAVAQQIEQFFVLERPLLTPLPYWKGILEGAGALLQQSQIMQRVENVLFAFQTAWVLSHDFHYAQHFNPKRIGTQRQLFANIFHWHGIAIGLKHHLAVWVDRCQVVAASGEVLRLQRQQNRFLALPDLCHRAGFSAHAALHVIQAGLMQHGVQFRETFCLWNGREKVSLGIAHVAFHAAFLMSLRRGTVMALEQVVTAEGGEGSLFLAAVSFQNAKDGRFYSNSQYE